MSASVEELARLREAHTSGVCGGTALGVCPFCRFAGLRDEPGPDGTRTECECGAEVVAKTPDEMRAVAWDFNGISWECPACRVGPLQAAINHADRVPRRSDLIDPGSPPGPSQLLDQNRFAAEDLCIWLGVVHPEVLREACEHRAATHRVKRLAPRLLEWSEAARRPPRYCTGCGALMQPEGMVPAGASAGRCDECDPAEPLTADDENVLRGHAFVPLSESEARYLRTGGNR